MAKTEDITTLICLFHHRDHASAATEDLFKQGIPPASINVIGSEGSTQETGTTLDDLGLPARDRQHLLKGLHDGGVIVAVLADSDCPQKPIKALSPIAGSTPSLTRFRTDLGCIDILLKV